MKKVPPHVSGSWLLVFLGVAVIGLAGSDAVDVSRVNFLAAVGATALGGVVLVLYFLGRSIR